MSGQPGQITLLAQYRVVEALILCVCLFVVVGGDGDGVVSLVRLHSLLGIVWCRFSSFVFVCLL